jgi:hypothetical protein
MHKKVSLCVQAFSSYKDISHIELGHQPVILGGVQFSP